LSAVALRLTDEVGEVILCRVRAGDLAVAAELDQHVAAVRGELAGLTELDRAAARAAGRRAVADGLRQAAAGPAHCPDVPFADNPWQEDPPPAIRLLLHYACGFAEAAVRADWWPSVPEPGGEPAWQAVRMAAVCALIQAAEAARAVPEDLR
jgi:hypothetical protein